MISQPLVSIIVPTKNMNLYIDQCLTSIEQQTYKNLEVIIVDYGSVDTTIQHIDKYLQCDHRFKCIEINETDSASAARNVGLANSSGEYLLFLDADDFISIDMVEILVNKASALAADIVICKSFIYDSETKTTSKNNSSVKATNYDTALSGKDLSTCVFQSVIGWAWDKLFSRSFLEKTRIKFQETKTTNDAFFVFINMCLADRIVFIEDYLPYHRINNKLSLENSRDKSWYCALKAIEAIKNELVRRNIYSIYKNSFLDWALSFSLWNINTLKENKLQFADKIMRDHAYLFEDITLDNILYSKEASLLRHLVNESSYFTENSGGNLLLSHLNDVNNIFEAFNALNEKIADTTFKVDNLEEELFQTKNELQKTKNELQESENQLSRIYNSKTWRLHAFINDKILFWRSK